MPSYAKESGPDDLLSPAEVEARLNISAETRRRYSKNGILPRIHLAGGAVRYLRSDVERVAAGRGA